MKWYLKVVRQYFVFSGRARRKEYWMFTLINLLFIFVAALIDALISSGSGSPSLGFISTIYSLFILCPILGLTVRRLHDTDKSGWWALLMLVPYLGWIVILIFMILQGQYGPNRYGRDPKFEGSIAEEFATMPDSGISSDNRNSSVSSSPSPASYLGDITDAEPVVIAGNTDYKGDTDASLWGVVGGFAITAFLLWGGLSESLVLRGTNSSTALVVVALLFLVYDIYKLVQYLNLKSRPKAPENATNNDFSYASMLPVKCPKCGSKSYIPTGTHNSANADLGAVDKTPSGEDFITLSTLPALPLGYQCNECKHKFISFPVEAIENERLEQPCTVLLKRMSNFVGSATINMVYLNGVKVSGLNNGKAISFPTQVKHNELVIADHMGNACKAVCRFEAVSGGKVQIHYNPRGLGGIDFYQSVTQTNR